MKQALRIAAVFALLVISAFGQKIDSDTPATREDIERYLEIVNSRQMMRQMMDAMSKPMHKMIHDEYVKDQDKLPANFEQQTLAHIDEMLKNMPFDEMMQATVPVYQKHFTKGDVEALTAFYAGPTGQKMLREMPAIMGEVMESMTPIMEKYIEAMRQKVEEQIADSLKQVQEQSDKKPQ